MIIIKIYIHNTPSSEAQLFFGNWHRPNFLEANDYKSKKKKKRLLEIQIFLVSSGVLLDHIFRHVS